MADLEAITAEVKDKDPELAAQMSKNLHLANVQLDNITSTNNAINFWLRGLPERNRKRNWGLTRKSNSDG